MPTRYQPQEETPIARFGPDEMRAWFAKLAKHLDVQLDGPPTGFLVVLLNDDEIRVWSAGPTHIRDDAVLAAKDARDHQKLPTFHDTPEKARLVRLALQRAREAREPFVCEICHWRGESRRMYERHQEAGHRCMTCQQIYTSIEAWRAHPCLRPVTPVLTMVPPVPNERRVP